MKHIYFLLIFIFTIQINTGFSQSCTSPVFADASAPPGTTSIGMACGGGTANMSATFSGLGAISTNLYGVSIIPFNFTSFTGTTIPITTDDIWSRTISLPFNFCFFGASYNSIVVGSNGIISFDVSTAGGICPWTIAPTIPSTSYPRASIMGVYNDIDPRYGSSTRRIQYTTIGTAPCRQFIVSFEEIAYYSSSCPGTLANYQIILNETTNEVDVQILNHNGCSSTNSGKGIVGIQSMDRLQAYAAPARNAVTFSTSNEAWRFTPMDTINPFRRMIVQLYENGTLVDSTTPYYSPFPTLRADFSRTITFPPDTHLFHIELIIRDSLGTGSGTSLCTVGSGLYDFNDLSYFNSGSFSLSSNITHVNCYGELNGAIDLTAVTSSPPISYVWSDGPLSEDRTSLGAGTYTVNASDLGGCTVTQTFTIEEPMMLMLMLDSIKHVNCFGDSSGGIQITTMGGTLPYLYNWTGGINTEDLNNIYAGQYTMMLVDSHGCVASDSFIVLPGTLDTSSSYLYLCPGDSIFLAGRWRTTNGSYFDTLTSTNGCDSIHRNVLSILSNSTNTINQQICNGESIVIAGNTYNTSGTFRDTLTSFIGCDSIIVINLVVNNSTLGSRNINACPGDVYFLGGANRSTNGTYYDTLVNIKGCDSILSSILTYRSISTHTRNVSICDGDNYYAGGANQTTAGSYFDTLVNYTGCDSILNTVLTILPTSSSSEIYSVCYGSSLFGITIIEDTIINNTYLNANGCDSINSIMINVLPLPIANAGIDQSINLGDSAILNASGGVYYYWNTGASTALTVVAPTSTTTYFVIATNADSCTSLDSITIEVINPSKSLIMPDAFTPNGDNLNDKFLPLNAQTFIIKNFRIFNRWGNIVYDVNSNTDGWNGTFNGTEQPIGTYVYYIQVSSLANGEESTVQGVVNLIR